MHDAIERSAQRLIDAATSGVPCDPIVDLLPDGTVDDAYAVQQRVIELTRVGARRVGRKIGLTSPVVQQMFGVDRPDFGVLFADMAIGDGEPVPRTRLMQPRVEAEVAFVLKSDLPDRPVIASDVMRATDFVVAAIEIVDSRITDWNISIVDTVADNASSGMFVLGGSPKRLRDVDVRACEMAMTVDGGDVVSSGVGAACLGLADQRRRVARQRRRRTRRAAAGGRGDPVRLARPPRHRRARQHLRSHHLRPRLRPRHLRPIAQPVASGQAQRNRFAWRWSTCREVPDPTRQVSRSRGSGRRRGGGCRWSSPASCSAGGRRSWGSASRWSRSRSCRGPG